MSELIPGMTKIIDHIKLLEQENSKLIYENDDMKGEIQELRIKTRGMEDSDMSLIEQLFEIFDGKVLEKNIPNYVIKLKKENHDMKMKLRNTCK